MGLGVGDPGGELFAGGDGTGGIVGETEVDQVAGGAGDGGNVAVGRGAFQVGDALVAAVEIGTGTAGHDVGIHVNGINGIRNGELEALGGENFLDVAAVTFGAVGDENLVGDDRAAARGVVVGGNGFAEEGVALLGAVALEGGAVGEFVGAALERIDADLRQGLGYVADAEADDGLVRMGCGVGRHALGDIGKQVAGFEFQVVLVDADHSRNKR